MDEPYSKIDMTGDRVLKTGDRVKRSDADAGIPAYRDMRGTIEGFDWTYAIVRWDIDPTTAPPSRHRPEDLVRDGDAMATRGKAYGGDK